MCIKVSLNVIQEEVRLVPVRKGRKFRVIASYLPLCGENADLCNVRFIVVVAALRYYDFLEDRWRSQL